ncbi:cation:proton antiporter [Catenovulum sediminis]|uniref:Sodium:proton antiporter n=1 Tax=Catenovulum sediminis TaxID=1740262 RepID=A0ABV1RC09_9ALTE|nr:sodium:proton antiporter [Catenovulum sediminis]
MSDPIIPLVAVGLISIACQFFAYQVKLPAILPLLIAGIIVGPLIGFIDADQMFGDLLFPIVSLSVAIILFEGALTLKFKDLKGHGSVVRNLCTVGALATCLIATFISHLILDISLEMAFLFGAIVTVTGPTVIVPMLRTVRPSAKIANILRWEGIVIDPIGALLAVLVFEYMVSAHDAINHTLKAFALTITVGAVFGAVAGYLLGLILRNKLIPHYLVNTAVLTLMLGVFQGSNMIAHESGLLAVTIMGAWLANMKYVEVDSILEFKETLSVLLISGLFILLASRIELASVLNLGWKAILVLLGIMFIARPISVMLSSVGAGLKWQEIALLSWIAPRGIVAAAVSALFALKLENLGYEEAVILVPMVFSVIIFTVVVQSLTAVRIARMLNLRAPKPNGYLIFGSGVFARLFAKELIKQDVAVSIADTNWDAISRARMDGIPTYFGNPMSEHAYRTLDISRYGGVLLLSPYTQLNSLLAYHFEHEIGKGSVWSLRTIESQKLASHQVSNPNRQKRCLFSETVDYGSLTEYVFQGGVIKTTKLSKEFSFDDYCKKYDGYLLPLCAIEPKGKIHMYTNVPSFKPKAGWRITSLIKPVEDEKGIEVVDGQLTAKTQQIANVKGG